MTEARLIIAGGPDAGREFAITGAVILGRDASAGIVVDDEEVSRRHTSVELAGDTLRIEDLGSTNGTFLNGERVEGTRDLKHGDKLRVGQTVFEVQVEQPEQATKIASVIPEEAGPQVTKPGTVQPEPPAAAEDAATVAPDSPGDPAPSAEPVVPAAQVTDVRQVPPEQPAPAVQATDVRQVPSDLPPPPSAAPGGPPPPAPGPPPPAPGAGPQSPAGFPGAAPPAGGLAPTGQPGALQAQDTIQERGSVPQWLLCIFIPFYSAYWYYLLCKELGGWSRGRIHTDPVKSVLAVTLGALILVPALISIAGTMGRIRQAQEMAGVEPRASFVGFFLRSFLFGYSYKWTQDQLNELAVNPPRA